MCFDPKAYYVANYAPFNIFNELDNNYIDSVCWMPNSNLSEV